MKILSLICFITLNAYWSFAQAYRDNEPDLSMLADELVGFQDTDADYEEIYENLVQIITNPLNLNTASIEQLRSLHMLSEKQIHAFMNYKSEEGNLFSIYELQAIPEFDLHMINRMLPFVKVIAPQSSISPSMLKRMLEPGNNYLLTRYERTIETKKGFLETDDDKRFKGSPDKFYMRFRSSKPGDFSIGLTADKDAGEPFSWSPRKNQYGPDFLSCHAQIINKGTIKNLLIGDFQCQFAQGLILGGAFGLGKGGETITTTRKSNIGILPYSSVNESGFYRGAAATIELHKNLLVSGFYSGTRRDATMGSDDALNTTISSFQYSGLHRSNRELANRKQILETSYGTVLNYRKRRVDAGIIFQSMHYSIPIEKTASVYNQFLFQGKQNTNISSFFNYTVSNFSFFSEAAKSLAGGFGAIAGVLGALHQNLEVSIVYRKFDKNFYTFYSNAFSENSQPQNETGIYWGWKYAWNKRYSVSGYTDLFRFPWLAYRRYAPSQGYEWLLRFNYQPSRNILMFVQAREESKARNLPAANNLYSVAQGTKRNYWAVVQYSVTDHLKLKTRAQFSTFYINNATTEGLVLLQDIIFSAGRFQFSARHALFDTEDYDNRQYVYENDAWMAFSFPAYYGVGIRNYFLIEYKVSKMLSFWIRYARTRYTNRDEIGSGSDAIEGNTRNDIKFQALVRF